MSVDHFPLYFVKQVLTMIGYKLKYEDPDHLFYIKYGNLIMIPKENELDVDHIFEIAEQMEISHTELLCCFRVIDYMSKNDYK